MIFFYCRDTDDLVNNVIDFLDEDFVRIGEKDFVSINEMNFNRDNHSVKISSDYNQSIDLQNINFLWCYGGVINVDGNPYVNECSLLLVESYFNNKNVKKLGRPIKKTDLTKLSLHLEAEKQGLLVPNTLITCDKFKLLSFFNTHKDNGVICKRILDTPFYETEEYCYDFTSTFSIDSDDFDNIPEQFGLSLFQERIIADFEIRVIFIDNTFFAMSVHLFENLLDYRSRLSSKKNIRLVPFKLPSIIEDKLRAVFKKSELNFGSADLMFADNQYYFLEVNPIGKVGFANTACNFYIEKYISELMKHER